MKYYYAYHGPRNTGDFDSTSGYGLTSETKRNKVSVGSEFFVIQKPIGHDHFRLCGIFKIISHYDDLENEFPYRFELENISKLIDFPILDEDILSEILPQKIGGNIGWSNFKKHFCSQGITFREPLQSEVSEILLSELGSGRELYEEVVSSFVKNVEKSLKSSSEERKKRLSTAKSKPKKRYVTTVVYDRNPDVVAEVLSRAGKYCEECGNIAPFRRKKDDTHYLEVHHKVPLAKGGDDTVDNAIALCPNCHREAHYG
ncbi:HNH endonuclease [Vibrio kanaloae]|uniref:HNH endonuclease n=1 Tax=Vibrio kanaloae TaxID=170673 RepID=UPI001EFC4BE2|nr:HNH endonuclease [Vibrio kanaloae]MCG9557820.1 HNH endonuclease [Vibrio kanaloae]